MTLERAKLDNGLTLYVDQMPSSLDNTVAMLISFGSVDETPSEEGIAHVVEHCVHLKTDEFENQQALDLHAEMHGMDTGAATGYTSTRYQANGLGIEPNIHYLSQILQHPHFPEEMVKGEIGVIRREAKMMLDDQELLHYVSSQNATSGHPYGRDISGYHNKINFESEALKRFHKQQYKLGNMTLVVAGSAGLDEVARLAEKHFVADGEYVDDRIKLERAYGRHYRTGYALEDANSVQMTVSHLMTSEFYERYQSGSLPYAIAAHVMGKAAFRLLRQERGIAYDGGISFSIGNHPNTWSISGDVETDAEHVALAEEAFDEIFSRDSSCYEDNDIKASLAMYKYGILKEASVADCRLAMHLGRLETYRDPLDFSTIQHQLADLTEADIRAHIDDIINHVHITPRYTHLTGTREDIGEVERVIDQSDVI